MVGSTVASANVALAAVHVNSSIDILDLVMDNVFTSECLVFVEWIVYPKPVGIDGDRFLPAVGQQESNLRFGGDFRQDGVPLPGTAISESEHRWLINRYLFLVRA